MVRTMSMSIVATLLEAATADLHMRGFMNGYTQWISDEHEGHAVQDDHEEDARHDEEDQDVGADQTSPSLLRNPHVQALLLKLTCN
jgi:hypothetical protein